MRFLVTAVVAAYAATALPGTSSPVVDMGLAVLQARAGCNAPGAVTGECGKVYDFKDCTGNEVWRIQPDVCIASSLARLPSIHTYKPSISQLPPGPEAPR